MDEVAANLYATGLLDLIGGDPEDWAAIDDLGRNQARRGGFLFLLRRSFGHADNIKHGRGLSRWGGTRTASVMLPGMPGRPSIAIIGPGNLGSGLALALARAGFPLATIVAHSPGSSLGQARALAKRVKSRAALGCKNLRAEVVWFCVPDSEIRGAARLFSRAGSWKGRVAFHSSGALNSDALESLRQKGAKVASVHPLMTFVERSAPALGGVPFAIEGDRAAVRVAGYIVKELGGYAHPIRKQDKAAYHAWATFTSPLLTALLATTEDVAMLAGLRGEDARGRMMPILRQTLANYAEFGAARGFSGPIIRGDVQTVKEHLEVLRKAPEARAVYVALARAATTCLPAKQKKALRRLLARPE
ncbi:MAG: DUF2520 domain-containing protein [Acidobacteria bacterium]|nr:MAG: DUF2520 domain-containing protein [Acidobacteriota bacterium]